jgi:hypothetical protein
MAKGTGYGFMLKTRYAYLEVSDQQKGVSPPPLEVGMDEIVG